MGAGDGSNYYRPGLACTTALSSEFKLHTAGRSPRPSHTLLELTRRLESRARGHSEPSNSDVSVYWILTVEF